MPPSRRSPTDADRPRGDAARRGARVLRRARSARTGRPRRRSLSRDLRRVRRSDDAHQAIPQPVIAEVARVATAAGCQLVAACDLAVASSEATFATPGVRIGLFCSTPMVALTRAIGRKRAMEMLLTGRIRSTRGRALAVGAGQPRRRARARCMPKRWRWRRKDRRREPHASSASARPRSTRRSNWIRRPPTNTPRRS